MFINCARGGSRTKAARAWAVRVSPNLFRIDELTHRAHHLRRERLTIVSGIGNFVVEADILATRRSEVLLEEPLELFGRTYDLCAGGR